MSELRKAVERLPHGPEFRFLDQLLELNPGQSGLGEYMARGDELFLRGHFPGNPILPGVLLIEAAAQLAGVVAQSDPAYGPLPGLKLTAIQNAKLLGAVRPGERVKIRANILGRMGNLVQARVVAEVQERKVLETHLTLSGDVA